MRHELRTPVNHILGYAEMLREDAPTGTTDAATLDRVIATAREVLVRINAALPPTGLAVKADVDALMSALREPQKSLLAETATLRSAGRDEQFTRDVERIAEAARRLTGFASPGIETPARGTRAVTDSHVAPIGNQSRVLIVDDVEENRAVLGRRLERDGLHVTSVSSGAQALSVLREHPFDLVLLDVLMPGMDGFAVLEHIKQDPASRHVPVIMISALDDMASVVRCIEHGAEDYLAKPFDPVLLRARIGASLEKKRWHDLEADYLRQVTRVIEAASAVEHGSYAPGMLGGITARDDALGRLARVFDSMALGVRAREERLREQLRELQTDVTIATTSDHQVADATDAADAFPPGSIVAGRYEVRGLIGRGGMGVVYQVHDRQLDEDVALKTIRSDLLSTDTPLVEQLRSEIRLARRISHRNVVRTHDIGVADGTVFVTMEYVRGITVRELLVTRGKLGVASALGIARQLAEALSVAHSVGVVHRDVKPENALVDASGVLKVMDFGIARLAEASSAMTQTGVAVGTPMYMAPEQLMGEAVDARADLYALGVVLYECLVGEPPFTAHSAVALIARVLAAEPVPLTERNPDVPPALSALVLRLLSKEPESRPATAAEVLAQLGEMT
jgi:CheY-like chemotaxis protein